MKLDWNCVRSVMSATEALSPGDMLAPAVVPGYAEDVVIEHIRLLVEAGMVDGYPSGKRSALFTERLTWDGHQLLATMKSPALWDRVKTEAKDRGLALSFDAIKVLAAKWLEAML